jgi:DNA-binding NarL/FixJ family response regulator
VDRPITCVVADDHPAVVDAVSRLLARHEVEVVGHACSGDEAITSIERCRPHVAVLDLRMPGPNPFEVASLAATASPETGVIVYSGYSDGDLLTQAFASGVRGVIVKDAPLTDLVRAIEMVADGLPYVDPTLATPLVHSSPADAGHHLTESERDVLQRLADGASTQRIAQALGSDEGAVHLEVKAAMRKLRADTQPQAVAAAMRRCLIR